MTEDKYHEPVLVKEVIAHLNKKGSVIDATLGTGGHTLAMLKEGIKVLGIESDPEILKIAKSRLEKEYSCPLVHGNFKDIDQIAKDNGFSEVDAVIFDLGVSNLQLTSSDRGFSFSNTEALLDMRIDPSYQGVTGADLLNGLRKDQLVDLFARILDRGSARWLSERVLERRAFSPIKTVGDLIEVCRGLKGKPALNPGTLPFLALRIAVNSELENIEEALPKAYSLLKRGGKLLVITFHSKEEEIVKNFSKNYIGPIKPTYQEILNNPRSRSAELFVIEKK